MTVPRESARARSASPDEVVDLLLIGVVARAHGLRGELLIVPHHAGSPLWAPGSEVFVVPAAAIPADARDRVRVSAAKATVVRRARKAPDDKLVVSVDASTDRDAAEALRGAHIGVDPARLPAPDVDEIYHHEVPGWAVDDVAGARVGTVLGVFSGPGGDLLEVAREGRDSVFVPFVAAIVTTIDRAGRRLVIDPPEGLLDLDDAPAPPASEARARRPRGRPRTPS